MIRISEKAVSTRASLIGGCKAARLNPNPPITTGTSQPSLLPSFNRNNRSLELSVAQNGGKLVVSLPDYRIPVEMVDARTALLRAGPHGYDGVAEIRAPMPGKIVKLLVTEGAAIEVNQGLLVMEAMKMQNEIKSPKKGIVRKLGVSENAAVNSGDLLVTVE